MLGEANGETEEAENFLRSQRSPPEVSPPGQAQLTHLKALGCRKQNCGVPSRDREGELA